MKDESYSFMTPRRKLNAIHKCAESAEMNPRAVSGQHISVWLQKQTSRDDRRIHRTLKKRDMRALPMVAEVGGLSCPVYDPN